MNKNEDELISDEFIKLVKGNIEQDIDDALTKAQKDVQQSGESISRRNSISLLRQYILILADFVNCTHANNIVIKEPLLDGTKRIYQAIDAVARATMKSKAERYGICRFSINNGSVVFDVKNMEQDFAKRASSFLADDLIASGIENNTVILTNKQDVTDPTWFKLSKLDNSNIRIELNSNEPANVLVTNKEKRIYFVSHVYGKINQFVADYK